MEIKASQNQAIQGLVIQILEGRLLVVVVIIVSVVVKLMKRFRIVVGDLRIVWN